MSSQIKEGVDFNFNIPEKDGSTELSIELTSGEYSGVTFSYGKVSFEEDVENEDASLVFEYTVIDSNGFDDLEENDDFKNHLGDILVSIIEKGAENDK
jgi:hypothetical protein